MKQTLFEIPVDVCVEMTAIDFQVMHGPNSHFVRMNLLLRGSKRTTVGGRKRVCFGHMIYLFDQRPETVEIVKAYSRRRKTKDEVIAAINKPAVVMVKETRTDRNSGFSITLTALNGSPVCGRFSILSFSERNDQTPIVLTNTALLTQSLYRKEKGGSGRQVALLTVTSSTRGIGFITTDRRYRSHRGETRQIRIFRTHQSSPANFARR
ncbi:hypothetical protein CO172_03470 [Candidatus Uhrbacteria bacterium CG_4_9_14_3_um_filter_36_7]|uniref:Uncharacterized protein n=1 Tax=Candidatus Uhrbacteria bacterium CG_4_9_14_3_um_filter_36_7 TaxID=1975033 RepID=A0A2M7XGM4_9BACT|nr:MAG: hypothetical protein CO172_03470 [Candidatus Uhrbacteria bacterium CG_4_9_14_3_um_filter_36_7]